MYSYRAYGLIIRSELALPELMADSGETEVDIRWGTVNYPPDVIGSEQCIWASPDTAIFYWDDVGTLLVRQGREVVVDPLPTVTEDILRLFILGAAFGTLLHQRGFLVLHASVVASQGSAIAFIGESGWGKSTTAAALCSMGYQAVADDILALEFNEFGQPLVWPGFPQFKLWSDAIAALGYDPETLPRLRPELEKRAHRLDAGFSLLPLPLQRIYVLGQAETLAIQPLSAQAAFLELVRHSYAVRFLGKQGVNARHFRHCSQLVQTIPISQLQRQPDLKALPAIVQCIEQDCARVYQSALA